MRDTKNIIEDVFNRRHQKIGVANYQYWNAENITAEQHNTQIKQALDDVNIAVEIFFCLYGSIKDVLPIKLKDEELQKIKAMIYETPSNETPDDETEDFSPAAMLAKDMLQKENNDDK